MNRGRITQSVRLATLLVAAMVAVLILSGCQAELPDDGSPPEISAAAARRFAEKAVAAGQIAANTGRFELTVTEGEATSFLNIGIILLQQTQTLPLEDLEQIQGIPELEGIDVTQWRALLEQRERLPTLPGLNDRGLRLRLTVDEPLVRFRGDGRMVVRGDVKVLILDFPVRFVVAPRASEGELMLDFVEGQLGALPMPEIIFDLVGSGLSNAILMGQEQTGAQITEISVARGTLTIRGVY